MKIDKAIEILKEHLSKIKTMEKLTSNKHFAIESGQQDIAKAIEIVLNELNNVYGQGFNDGANAAANDILGRI